MGFLVSIIILFGQGPKIKAQAPANALTAEEAAQGWTLLFDGKDHSGLIIEGEAQVVNGVLSVGGARESSVRLKLGNNYELRLEYRFEGKEFIVNSERNRRPWGRSGYGNTFHGSGDQWREGIFTGIYDQQTATHSDTARCRLPGEPAFGQDGFEGNGIGGDRGGALVLQIPAGEKLYLRNIKLKSDPIPPDLLWVYISGILIGVLIAVIILVFLFRKRPSSASGNSDKPQKS